MIRLWTYAGIALVIAGLLGLTYHGCRKQWEAEQQLKALKEVQRKTEDVTREQEKRKQAVEHMSPDELLKYWRGLHDGSNGSPATPAGKANADKP